MDSNLTPRHGPADHSISDQISPFAYYTSVNAATTLANAVGIDCRGKRTMYIFVLEDPNSTSMSGECSVYSSPLNIAGDTSGYESVPLLIHQYTADAVTDKIKTIYRIDLTKEGCNWVRIATTMCGPVAARVTIGYSFGD